MTEVESGQYTTPCEYTLRPKRILARQVKIWFQNRRMKWRNSKERELLATGGSREQTLPNKNNPNPDLSDADGDRPRMDLSDVSPLTSPQRPEEQTENEEDEEINVT
ncbi:homeobox protein DBX1-like [Vespula squamosa]|uniref:Homeobox protein DBX1-like n=1 Tax=Vespula squamosa TaxID=30214 RepID=A0ABD2AP46_VESSQ